MGPPPWPAEECQLPHHAGKLVAFLEKGSKAHLSEARSPGLGMHTETGSRVQNVPRVQNDGRTPNRCIGNGSQSLRGLDEMGVRVFPQAEGPAI